MSNTIHIVGIDDFFDELKNMEISDAKKRRALKKCGDILIDGIEPSVPKRTGRLRKGLKKTIKKTDEGMSVIVSTSSFYDVFQEFGTSQDKSNVGFFEKAVRAKQSEAVSAVIEELSK
jgi:HK97 gp10 family phage protein